MKKIIEFLSVLFVLGFIFTNNSYAAGSNLIPNNSAEDAGTSSSAPEYWIADEWGINNPEFEYRDFDSQDLQKSLYVNVSDYVSGDAKWYFEPVAVNPSTLYVFKDYYKSNTSSEVVLQMTDFFGNSTYTSLGELAPTTNWTPTTFSFITLPTTSKVTVMHIIKNNGYLWTDNFYLSEGSVFTITDNVPNNSFEEFLSEIPDQPLAWGTDSWGTNTPVFTYLNTGHTGERSAKVEITSYSDGDAKWYFEPQPIIGGHQYRISNFYQSNVSTRMVIAITMSNDITQYVELPFALSSSGWSSYTGYFTAPVDSKNVTVYHLIDKVGYLVVDDYSLIDTTATPTPTSPPNQSNNLVPNFSVETASFDPNIPVSWNKGGWGTNNASFEYLNEGHTGSRSIKVTINSYVDGDAKWYFEPQPVTAGKTYKISDYYKSNVNTRVVIWFQTEGGDEYIELDPVSASADWNNYQSAVEAPAGSRFMTVFHLIDSVGYLVTDDFGVEEVIAQQSLIPNSSLEEVSSNPNQPAFWTTGSWGTNTPVFTYLNTGHTGERSAKVEITSYSDGDAKWYFEPISVDSGQTYKFSDFYQANIPTKVVAMFIKNDGSEMYLNLKTADTSLNWKEYTDVFTVPEGVVSASILHLVSSVGYLIVDDYSLSPYSQIGFDRGLVSITLDDGLSSQYTQALPILAQKSFPATFYLTSGFIGSSSHMTSAQVNSLLNSGNQVGSHTVSHPHLTQLSDQDLDFELSQSQQYLANLTGQPIVDMATPFGEYDSRVLNKIQQYYRSHRSVEEGFNSKELFNIYDLKVKNIFANTTAEEVQSWVEDAKNNKMWLILVYHDVSDTPSDEYGTTPALFGSQMEVIKNSGIQVSTIDQALNEILPQL